MQISREVAGFSRGKADKLRKAMGKKKKDVLDGLKNDFMKGALERGHDEKMLEKIWSDWEAFAKYAFNKSHAACYAWVSYQTAWLKAHYPSEFQASNLTQQSSDMDELKEIMADCKKAGIKVLNPDVNESDRDFSVNAGGDIRFGFSGLKGFGSNITDAIIAERESGGNFADVFDFMERLSGTVNRKALETLVCAGAFDSFGYRRSQFFTPCPSGELFIDELIRYADLYKNDTVSAASSLFGDMEEMKPQRPQMPAAVGEEDVLDILQKEKEFVGMYLSAHPLDKYSFEIENFTTHKLVELQAAIDEAGSKQQTSRAAIAGIVTDVKKLVTKTGKPGARVLLEDYSGPYELALFGSEYENYLPFMSLHSQLYIEGEIAPRYHLKQDEIAAGKTAPFNFKIKKISMLGNISEQLVKSFAINLDTSALSKAFRSKLEKALAEFPGATPLAVNLFDAATGYRIEMKSKKYSINVCEGLLLALEHLGVSYSVLK